MSLETESQQSIAATDTITAQKVSSSVLQELNAQVSTDIATAHEKATSESDNITSQAGLCNGGVVHNVTENSVRETSVATYAVQQKTQIVSESQSNFDGTVEVCSSVEVRFTTWCSE